MEAVDIVMCSEDLTRADLEVSPICIIELNDAMWKIQKKVGEGSCTGELKCLTIYYSNTEWGHLRPI